MNHTQEKPLYSSGDIQVTRSRFVGSQTYAVRNLTSVRAVTIPPNRILPVTLAVIGALAASRLEAQPVIIGLALIGFAAFLWVNGTKTHQIIVVTAGGEQTAYQSRSRQTVTKILNALESAVAGNA